jgi:hypothetical protein
MSVTNLVAKIRAQNIARSKAAGVPVGDQPGALALPFAGFKRKKVRLVPKIKTLKPIKRKNKKKNRSKAYQRDAMNRLWRMPGSFEGGKRR